MSDTKKERIDIHEYLLVAHAGIDLGYTLE